MLDDESPRPPSQLSLPARPEHLASARVAAWRAPLVLPTYHPAAPDVLPAYLDRRVYQGSSGRVYPLPFHDRVAAEPVPHAWDAVHLENDWLRVVLLPELGGRVHVARDLTRRGEGSDGYDFFYANPVVKPALVGLAGPWVAGGVEFNWPQHHRPATYLPTDCELEHHDDGSVTAWCSDHDPFARMKGMHGVRLLPDAAVLEVHARLHNRSELPQTFLWWANVAARVHDDYQSFFPRDVEAVADHAERAVTAFPAADSRYYGVDYPARHDDVAVAADGTEVRGDRLDWYRNIPVPTSYMAVGSREGFFGGYDHAARAGFVHVADPAVAVGKKQWTWGDALFGHAWDANLSDDGAHYVELMAGVFTTNQPDFSHLAPGETKVFSQTWAPVQDIGPAHAATTAAALRVDVLDGALRVGLAAFAPGDEPCVITVLGDDGAELASAHQHAGPGSPALLDLALPDGAAAAVVEVRRAGEVLVRWEAQVARPAEPLVAATEPPAPADLATAEELWLVGAHLEQYRHATRDPEPYWRRALEVDPRHVPSLVSLGRTALSRGLLARAEELLRAALARQTRWNAHPADTSAAYLLGVVLEARGNAPEAYDAFAAASWARPWRAAAGYRMARLDAAAGRHAQALHRLDDVARTEPEHLQARALRVLVLQRLGRAAEAEAAGRATLALDPLDHWTRHLLGLGLATDAQTCLDVALEHAAAGDDAGALAALDAAEAAESRRALGAPATGPLLAYHRAAVLRRAGRTNEAARALEDARTRDTAWCFPGRLADALVLEAAADADETDARAQALLGHWLYANGRREDAADAWRASARATERAGGAPDAVVWRNRGLAAHDVDGDPEEARRCYDVALAADPGSARLVYESDQLDARRGVPAAQRLRRLEAVRPLVAARDDTTVQLAHLLLDVGRTDEARDLLAGRTFQPWEGGEGEVLRAWERACRLSAHRAAGEPGGAAAALAHLDAALVPPATLGEARHPLASTAELLLLRGDALALLGEHDAAAAAWASAAADAGDFTAMAAEEHSEATAARVVALRRLDRDAEADALTDALGAHAEHLAAQPAVVDYFATSLPALLLFAADPGTALSSRVEHLRAQVELLRGRPAAAAHRLARLLERHPDLHDAADLAAHPHLGLRPAALPPSDRPERDHGPGTAAGPAPGPAPGPPDDQLLPAPVLHRADDAARR